MMIKFVLMLEFWSLVIYGAFNMIRGARKIRSARRYKDFTFAWSERPLSSFKHDTISWIAISIHWISLVVIGLIEFFVLVNLRPFPLAASSLVPFILMAITPMVGFLWGSMLFQPVATLFAGNRHYALSTEGILWAGHLVPWNAFSHFSLDREKYMIRLWSASLRGTIALLFAPPDEHVLRIAGILQSHLPNEDSLSSPSLLAQCAFPSIMAASCMLIVAIAYFLMKLPLEITFIANAILMYVLTILGGPVLLRSLLGKNLRPAVME
jgi:hypothetical protein